MIPAIFPAKALMEVGPAPTRRRGPAAVRRAGALIGLAGAIGAFGGVLVNLAFRQSFLTSKNGDGAYIAFIAFYAVCCRGHLGGLHPALRGASRGRVIPRIRALSLSKGKRNRSFDRLEDTVTAKIDP